MKNIACLLVFLFLFCFNVNAQSVQIPAFAHDESGNLTPAGFVVFSINNDGNLQSCDQLFWDVNKVQFRYNPNNEGEKIHIFVRSGNIKTEIFRFVVKNRRLLYEVWYPNAYISLSQHSGAFYGGEYLPNQEDGLTIPLLISFGMTEYGRPWEKCASLEFVDNGVSVSFESVTLSKVGVCTTCNSQEQPCSKIPFRNTFFWKTAEFPSGNYAIYLPNLPVALEDYVRKVLVSNITPSNELAAFQLNLIRANAVTIVDPGYLRCYIDQVPLTLTTNEVIGPDTHIRDLYRFLVRAITTRNNADILTIASVVKKLNDLNK